HRPIHVDVAGVDELLAEGGHGARDIPEVNVEDLVARAEVADLVVDVDVVLHLCHRPLAELDAIAIARIDLDQSLVRGEIAQDLRNTAEHRHWRITRMNPEANAFLFGNRRDDAYPVLEIRPDLVLRVDPLVRQWHALGEGVVEGGRDGPAAD